MIGGLLDRSDSRVERIVPPSGFTASLTVLSAAAMAFLAVFIGAISMSASRVADDWGAALGDKATIRLSAPAETLQDQIDAVMTIAAQTPGVVGARQLTEDEQRALLAPWFGTDAALEGLRLPVLFDLTLEGDGPDIEGLRRRLQGEAPGAVYDDHARWRLPMVRAADRMSSVAGVSLVLIAAIGAAMVALAASASLSANRQIIGVLRLVGAKDVFITRIFVRRFTLRTIGGAVTGSIAGMIVVVLMPGGGGFIDLRFAGAGWLWPALVPLAGGGISYMATRYAAFRRLKELS